MKRYGAVIYGLVDPRTGTLRYVGRSVDMVARFRQHLKGGGAKTPVGDWIAGLTRLGLVPSIVTLAEHVPVERAGEAERYFIGVMREGGADLLNLTPGGDGGSGKGRVLSPEGEARRLEGLRAYNANRPPASAETRAKQRAAKLGRVLTAGHRAKIGAAGKGRRTHPSTRPRLRHGIEGASVARKRARASVQARKVSATLRPRRRGGKSRRHA